jgi:pimeloyl-ACP methyl ester carboxylesterase
MWLRALYPWIFGQGFFADAANVDIALEAALAYPHAQTADAMAHQIEMFRAFRPKADVATLHCPTLVLYAGQDILVPPEVARPSFRSIPRLTEATLPDAGHSIVWDAPEEVARHLSSFLAQHPL